MQIILFTTFIYFSIALYTTILLVLLAVSLKISLPLNSNGGVPRPKVLNQKLKYIYMHHVHRAKKNYRNKVPHLPPDQQKKCAFDAQEASGLYIDPEVNPHISRIGLDNGIEHDNQNCRGCSVVRQEPIVARRSANPTPTRLSVQFGESKRQIGWRPRNIPSSNILLNSIQIVLRSF